MKLNQAELALIRRCVYEADHVLKNANTFLAQGHPDAAESQLIFAAAALKDAVAQLDRLIGQAYQRAEGSQVG